MTITWFGEFKKFDCSTLYSGHTSGSGNVPGSGIFVISTLPMSPGGGSARLEGYDLFEILYFIEFCATVHTVARSGSGALLVLSVVLFYNTWVCFY